MDTTNEMDKQNTLKGSCDALFPAVPLKWRVVHLTIALQRAHTCPDGEGAAIGGKGAWPAPPYPKTTAFGHAWGKEGPGSYTVRCSAQFLAAPESVQAGHKEVSNFLVDTDTVNLNTIMDIGAPGTWGIHCPGPWSIYREARVAPMPAVQKNGKGTIGCLFVSRASCRCIPGNPLPGYYEEQVSNHIFGNRSRNPGGMRLLIYKYTPASPTPHVPPFP